MTKISTAIVDDEIPARRRIRRLLEGFPELQVVAECRNGHEALEVIQRLTPELVFLDVQMPELNGFEVVAQLAPKQRPVIIFVTAHDKFALQAFEAQAVDYLLKPYDDERFEQAVRRALTYVKGAQTAAFQNKLSSLLNLLAEPERLTRIAVKSSGRVVFIRVEEIDWIESAGNYVKVHIHKESYMLRGRLSEMAKRLDPTTFFQIHRTTIVNLDRMKEFLPLFKGEGVLVLKDGTRLDVSRNCSAKLQELLMPRL